MSTIPFGVPEILTRGNKIIKIIKIIFITSKDVFKDERYIYYHPGVCSRQRDNLPTDYGKPSQFNTNTANSCQCVK